MAVIEGMKSDENGVPVRANLGDGSFVNHYNDLMQMNGALAHALCTLKGLHLRMGGEDYEWGFSGDEVAQIFWSNFLKADPKVVAAVQRIIDVSRFGPEPLKLLLFSGDWG
jgi:hypothetical protein